jgi:hypothetical protein
MGHMSSDEGSIEVRDLRDELLEAMMFLYPSLDILQHIERNIRGFGLSFDGSGQIPADVLLPFLAAAASPSTMLRDLHQGPRQDRADPGQFPDPGVSHATDERRVFRHLHTDKLQHLSELVNRNPSAKKKNFAHQQERELNRQICRLNQPQRRRQSPGKVRRIGYSSELGPPIAIISSG